MKKKILLTSIVTGVLACAALVSGGKKLSFNAFAENGPYTLSLNFENSSGYGYLANWEINQGSFTRQTTNGNDVTFSVTGMEEMWGVFAKATTTSTFTNTTRISGMSKISINTAQTALGGGYEIEFFAEVGGPSYKVSEKLMNDTGDTWVDSHTKVYNLPAGANYFKVTCNDIWLYSVDIEYSCTPTNSTEFANYANKVNSEKASDLIDNIVSSKYSYLKSEMLYGSNAPDGRDSVLKVEVESNHYEWPRFTLDLGRSYDLSNSTMTLDSKLMTAQAGPYASVYALLDSSGNKVNASEMSINAKQNAWSTATITSSATDVRYVVISYQCASASDVLYLDNLNIYSNTRGEAIERGKVYTLSQPKTGKFNVDINFTSERSWNSRFLIVFYDWDVGGTYSARYEIEGNNTILDADNGWTSNQDALAHTKTIGSYERFEIDISKLHLGAGAEGTIQKIHAIQILNDGWGDGTSGYIDFNA